MSYNPEFAILLLSPFKKRPTFNFIAVHLFNYEVPKDIIATELVNKLHEDLFMDMFTKAAKDGLLPSRQVVHLDELDENGEPIIKTKSVVDIPLPRETVEYTHILPGTRPANLPPGVQPRRAARIPVVIVKLKSRKFSINIKKTA